VVSTVGSVDERIDEERLQSVKLSVLYAKRP
jgi:hypothetical protein